MKLGYWNIRGTAELLWVTMKYLDMEFEDIKYNNEEDWKKEKQKQMKEKKFLPNLPYLIDGDFYLSESN